LLYPYQRKPGARDDRIFSLFLIEDVGLCKCRRRFVRWLEDRALSSVRAF